MTTLRVSNFLSEEHPYAAAMTAWMDEVTKATDGKVKFETYYNASLCDSQEGLSCVGDGTADIGMAALAYTPEMTLANVGGVPFHVSDPQAVGDTLNRLYADEPAYRAEYEDRNTHMMFAFGDSKPVLSSTKKLSSLSDLNGLSLRTGGPLTTGVGPLGVKAVAIAPEAMYESIERNVVNGAMMALMNQVEWRLQEVAPYFYDVGTYTGVYSTISYAINLDTWNSLSESIQEAMKAANSNISSRMQADFVIPEIARNCKLLKDSGNELSVLGPESAGEAWKAEAGKVQRSAWIKSAEASHANAAAYFDNYVKAAKAAEEKLKETPENHEICAGS